MWRYIHARTLTRVLARIQGAPADRSESAMRHIRRAVESKPAYAILQVGSYDGVSNDPVHDLIRSYDHIRAVLLEPQPAPFAALQAHWAGTARVRPVQCALADRCGERPLYVIAEAHKHQHPFPDQVASFLRSQVEFAFSRYAWAPPPDAITSVPVPTIDWRTLMQQHGPFDLLAIDAEGYDAEILRQIDFSNSPPGIILYEHRCLSRRVQRECQRLLEKHGYSVSAINNADSLAVRSRQL